MCTVIAKAPQFIGSCAWLPSGPSNKTHLFCVTLVYQRCQTFEHLLISSLPICWARSLWILCENLLKYVWFSPKCYFRIEQPLQWWCLSPFSNQKFHLRGLWSPAHVTAMTSRRTSRSYWLLCFNQSDKGVCLDSPNICMGHLTGQRSMWRTTFAPHPFFSNIPTHLASPPPHPTKKKKGLSERWDFFEFPPTLLPRSNKVTKRSSEGTTNHLSQSIQWTGRSGAWHLYAIIHAISIYTVKGKDSALLLNGKGYRVWTFCCCGVPGHGMHATVHVIFHSSSQSASFGVWCT